MRAAGWDADSCMLQPPWGCWCTGNGCCAWSWTADSQPSLHNPHIIPGTINVTLDMQPGGLFLVGWVRRAAEAQLSVFYLQAPKQWELWSCSNAPMKIQTDDSRIRLNVNWFHVLFILEYKFGRNWWKPTRWICALYRTSHVDSSPNQSPETIQKHTQPPKAPNPSCNRSEERASTQQECSSLINNPSEERLASAKHNWNRNKYISMLT